MVDVVGFVVIYIVVSVFVDEFGYYVGIVFVGKECNGIFFGIVVEIIDEEFVDIGYVGW